MTGPDDDDRGQRPLPPALLDRLFELMFGNGDCRDAAIAALLAAHPEHAAALRARWHQHLALEGRTDTTASPATLPEVPGFRLLGVLGEGGMGTVYHAEQLEPRRPVALKVIKPGMDSRQVLARFELERQSLAAMNHEAIAKVFGCGATSRGLPFFAMELVPGLPLHHWCDERRLPLPERIRLFQQVCEGVQHAHQKGVIHRDLKPGNILVVERDGRAIVKIIDFGVARAADPRQPGATLFTEQGAVLGTPEYMSPEQAAGDLAHIDTRTDVYSLGVVLYELLVGVLPFSGEELRAAGFAEIQHQLREVDPPTPSHRLTALGPAAATCARRRALEPTTLHRELARDLDWVVLRAMAKEPDRRYASAQALAEDLGRYLAHEPLQAGPPTAIYRLRKLLRRHRGPFAAAGAVLLMALLGTALIVRFAWREQQKVNEFRLLSTVVDHARAVAGERRLYPAVPERLAAMDRWLADIDQLAAMRPAITATLTELRSRALPPDADAIAPPGHARAAELAQLQAFAAATRRAMAYRDGQPSPPEPELTPVQLGLGPRALEIQAWQRVAPDRPQRRAVGEEALGLAMARVALARAEGKPEACGCLFDLAWACLANGRDAEARQHAATAVERALPNQAQAAAGHHDAILHAIATARADLATLTAEVAALRQQVEAKRTFRFVDTAEQYLHDRLTELLPQLDDLIARSRPEVEHRRRWAQALAAMPIDHANARVRWAAVRTAVAGNERYAGAAPPLGDEDVRGLVPIGENPQSKLWEFYDLYSAWDGHADPASLPIPQHAADGSLAVDAATGIVFVLLPGGRFWMGAQKGDPTARNHDQDATPDAGPVHEVSLAPFLLGRYELTQAQWARLWTWDESLRRAFYHPAGSHYGASLFTAACPADFLSWDMCELLLTRCGLVLPTEAQWEYACRAGTSAPWSCPRADLSRHANLDERQIAKLLGNGANEPWNDGHEYRSRTGALASNAFGLHDMHGNVWEWCQDFANVYTTPKRAGDGLSIGRFEEGRSHRGASSANSFDVARSAHRGMSHATFRGPNIGVRAARLLQATR